MHVSLPDLISLIVYVTALCCMCYVAGKVVSAIAARFGAPRRLFFWIGVLVLPVLFALGLAAEIHRYTVH